MRTIRKRYYFWLIRAYLKQWKRTILTSVVIGIVISGIGIGFLNFYVKPYFDNKVQRIGMFGVYSPKDLPDQILGDISYGLTTTKANGSVVPAAAASWEVQDKGKKYIFHLKKNLSFHNGDQLTAQNLPLSFKDASKQIIDPFTVAFTLDAPYSPFLTTVSKPILETDFSGLGRYKLRKLDLNAGFVKSLTLQDTKDPTHKKIIFFYPTQQALKTAYMLGEVDEVTGLTSLSVDSINLAKWKNTKVNRTVNKNELITLFYNNADSNLSSKKIRQALNYALPEEFPEGERARSPIHVSSIYYAEPSNYIISDTDIAKEVLKSSGITLDKPIEITTSQDLENTAREISQSWKKIGVQSKIIVSDDVPQNFQVLLYRYKVPMDPDQYTLWHSDQVNNIGKYKNLRIDKLLEDGRVETNTQERIRIYADFQKYLLDDVPASFLYYPIEYTVVRK